MTWYRSSAVIGVLIVRLAASPSPSAAQSSRPDPEVLGVCSAIDELVGTENGLRNLVNPVVRNLAEIEARADAYREMLSCLDSVTVDAGSLDWARNLHYHLSLFLSFAAPVEFDARGSVLELVDLEASQDPAVRRLIEDVGLSPPEGLILVRYFRNREQMPEIIRRAFENPQTQAVTMASRFVAVLTMSSTSFTENRIGDVALAATFSHELVHAFLNARLDPELSPEGFPRWFHEGMAIHFSDGGRAHISVDPVSGGLLRIEPTVQYEQYERVFRYLEAGLGVDQFDRELRRSIENVDSSILYTAMGLASYDDLAQNAELWWRWWPVPLVFVRSGNAWWWGSLIAVLSAGAIVAWRRWQPAVPGSALEVGVNSDLIEAVKMCDIVSVRHLLRSGANPNTLDDGGWSALAWAIWVNNAQIVELLLGRGAEVTQPIRALTESRDCSPRIMRVVADTLMRDNHNSVEMDPR